MIIVTANEHGTDEDLESTSKVAKIIIDAFLKRPSVEDRAIRGMAEFANNGLFMEQSGGHREDRILCDAGILFMFRNKCRWLISGKSRIYHFEDGKLARMSDPAEAPMFGEGPTYRARLEEAFEITHDENAFLVCSGTLAESVTTEQLEELLKESKDPEQFVAKIVEAVGEDKQYCMNAVFLPKRRKKLFGIF